MQIGWRVIIVTKFRNLKRVFFFFNNHMLLEFFLHLSLVLLDDNSVLTMCATFGTSNNTHLVKNKLHPQVAQRQQEGKQTHSNHSEFPPQTRSHLALVHICAGLWGSSGQWWQVGRPAPEPVDCCTSGESQVHSPAWCPLRFQHWICELNEGTS